VWVVRMRSTERFINRLGILDRELRGTLRFYGVAAAAARGHLIPSPSSVDGEGALDSGRRGESGLLVPGLLRIAVARLCATLHEGGALRGLLPRDEKEEAGRETGLFGLVRVRVRPCGLSPC
jgi:hypothetical protein